METRVSEAAARAGKHIERAGTLDSAVERCVAYLEAAREAVYGLEAEYDELLVQAKFCDLTDSKARTALDERIERYLHLDLLRPRLQDATRGLETCLEQIPRAFSPDTAEKLTRTLEQLTVYLNRLDQEGLNLLPRGTGIVVTPLQEIQIAYLRNPAPAANTGREGLRTRVEAFQGDRSKAGLMTHTGQIRNAIETLKSELGRLGDGLRVDVRPLETPKIFISHCHQDEDIAWALVNLLEVAISPQPNEIRCTSLPGYKLQAGSPVPDALRAEIAKVRVVLGIVTPNVSQSPYVLFELGAAWGLDKPIFPLVAGNVNPDQFLGPIASRHCIALKSNADCHQLVEDVIRVTALPRTPENAARIADRVERLVNKVANL